MSGLWVVCVFAALCSVAVSQTFEVDDEDCYYDPGSGSGGFDLVNTHETSPVDVSATRSTAKTKSTVKDVEQNRLMAPDATKSPPGKDKSWGLIVGVPVGVAAFLVCVIIVLVIVLKHRRRPKIVTEKTIEEETKIKAENTGNEYVEVKVENNVNEYAEV